MSSCCYSEVLVWRCCHVVTSNAWVPLVRKHIDPCHHIIYNNTLDT